MSSTMDDTWTRPGTFGWWTSPTGARCWLFPPDYPMEFDGAWVIVRMVEPALISMAVMLGLEQARKYVLVSVVDEPGAFHHVATVDGGEGLDGRVEAAVRDWCKSLH